MKRIMLCCTVLALCSLAPLTVHAQTTFTYVQGSGNCYAPTVNASGWLGLDLNALYAGNVPVPCEVYAFADAHDPSFFSAACISENPPNGKAAGYHVGFLDCVCNYFWTSNPTITANNSCGNASPAWHLNRFCYN